MTDLPDRTPSENLPPEVRTIYDQLFDRLMLLHGLNAAIDEEIKRLWEMNRSQVRPWIETYVKTLQDLVEKHK